MTPWPARNRGDAVGFAIVAVAVLSGGIWAVTHSRLKDPYILQSTEGRRMANLAAAMNPQLELLTFDEPLGTISLRERGSGKIVVYRYNFDQRKKEFVIAAPDGTGVHFKAGEPGASSLETRYPDFTVKTTPAAQDPTVWIPAYPDASPKTMSTISGKGEETHIFWFDTEDSVEKVRSVYTELFSQQGFTRVTATAEPGVLTGEAASGKRRVQIRTKKSGRLTHVFVYAVEKQ